MLKNAAIVSLLFLAAAAAGPRAEEVTVTTPVAESAWIGVIVAEAPGSGVRVVVTVDGDALGFDVRSEELYA